MTPLIDTIERAFIQHRDATIAFGMGEITCTPIVEAIEQYAKVEDDGRLEGIVDDAILTTARLWGNDWPWQSGHVAELIVDGLRTL